MSIRFQNMSFYYPVMYLCYQAVFMLLISIDYLQSNSSYIVLSLQIVYLLLLIYLRPYNTLRKLNRLLHNVTIVFNQAFVITFVSIAIRWNQIIDTEYQKQSNPELTAYCFLIFSFGLLAIILAIARLLTFNQDISFKCFKKDEADDVEHLQEADYDHMKRMIIDDKEKLLKNRIPENVVNPVKADKELVPLKKKKIKD